MKKIKILSSILILKSFIFAEKWLPYYSFNFSEGVYLPSVGKWGWTTILSNDIGFIVKPVDKHTGMFYYQLKYEGPGLKRQEGEQFEQRMMGHSLVLQYSYQYAKFIFKTRLNYGYDFWRTGTNELWGLGLYDNERIGFTEEVEYQISNEFKLKTQLGYNFIKFPNYTNLIEEYISGSEETTAGKQDNHMFILGLKGNYKIHNFGITMTLQNFVKQNVLKETGIYSDEKQKDFSLNVSYYPEIIKLAKFISFSPYFSVKYKDSNQAFLYLTSYDITTSTPQVINDYYDYTKFIISLPVNFYLTKTKVLTFAPEAEFTSYLSRQPRDRNNNFIMDEKQRNQLTLLSLIYSTQSLDQHRKLSLFYTYQHQTSNMKFEKYYPYNYTGHYFGIKFTYSY
ncbi:MAG: hypothetical protein NZ928_03095 [Endomicrobia bacterium]|nr:hypothetical protein [Endomicrobiia bacterium]MDW8055550.1 hypothetical protein [Elusimicrobiota bacterium]